MISLYKLVNSTPTEVRRRASAVTVNIKDVTMGKKKSGGVVISTIVFTGEGKARTENDWYDIVIELYPTEIHQNIFSKVGQQNMAWVKCSCPYFHFNCKYVLNKKGSTNIGTGPQYGSRDDEERALAPAKITNRGGLAYLCKHLFAAQDAVVKRAQELAKEYERKAGVKFTNSY